MQLHVDCQKWDEAFMLAKQNPEMESIITLPYADWLSVHDRFEEAQEAYKKANRPDLSLKIIEFLSNNAISEKRFQDAAQYYWMLATESLSLVSKVGGKATKDDKKYLKAFEEYTKLAEIYQAYNNVSKFVEETYRTVI
jgi:intraflagellar transport protein 122